VAFWSKKASILSRLNSSAFQLLAEPSFRFFLTNQPLTLGQAGRFGTATARRRIAAMLPPLSKLEMIHTLFFASALAYAFLTF
jgi:hypothetical protein